MCCDDPKMVRYSHATDGGTLAIVDVKPFQRFGETSSRHRMMLSSPQSVLARSISISDLFLARRAFDLFDWGTQAKK